MSLKIKSFILYLVVLVAFMLPFHIYAASPDTVSVDITPISPAPGENATITLGSYADNLDAIVISWFVNGKKVSSGIGIKSITVVSSVNGSDTAVRALVSLPDGEIEKKIIIRPSSMVLLWQAIDSYVPPFYRGKAMPTTGNDIKIVAMPEIKNGSEIINPKTMLYAWKLNYTNDTEGSGYGKNSFTFTNDYLESSDNVSVTASTIDNKYSLQANINLSASNPQISFYKRDRLLGTDWSQTLKDGHKITGDEVVVAEPYFITPAEIQHPSLIWSWFINDSLTYNVSDYWKNWIPLRVEGGISGVSTLRLQIENKDQLLGTVNKQINIEF